MQDTAAGARAAGGARDEPADRLAVFGGVLAMVLFSGNFASARHGLENGLSVADLVLIRYAVSGPLYLLILLRIGPGGATPGRAAVLTLLGGVPYFLLTAGAPGKRFALPNSRIMVHQPSGGAQGQATDIEIQAREILKLRQRLNEIYVQHTGQPLDVIERKLERDSFMSADEAKDFGIVDQVVQQRPPAPGGEASKS